MRLGMAIVLLGVLAVGSGCSSVGKSAWGALQYPGCVIHTVVTAPVIAWHTKDFAQYAQDFDTRVKRGDEITVAEYKDFVNAERTHWNVFYKTEQ